MNGTNDQALMSFKKLVENQKKDFTDDEVLKLSEELGKFFASSVGKDKKENSTCNRCMIAGAMPPPTSATTTQPPSAAKVIGSRRVK